MQTLLIELLDLFHILSTLLELRTRMQNLHSNLYLTQNYVNISEIIPR
jgi:hypothetical protein